MTERGPLTGLRGAPNPAEHAHPGDSPAPQGGSAADLGEVRRTDALIEALAARRAAGSAACTDEGGRPRPADEPDPAVRLLRALISDVDDPGCETTDPPAPPPPPPAPSGPRRRGPRTIVALGVAGAVLASSGVAAAGGGVTERTTASPAPAATGVPGDTDRATTDQDTTGTFAAGMSGAGETEATTPDRPRPPTRPAPEPEADAPSRSSADPSRADYEHFKRRLEHHFPRRRPGRPEAPAVNSAPSTRPDDPSDDDPRRRLEDLRREAQERALHYRFDDD